MTQTDEIAEIARGLSEAQRRVLLTAEHDGTLGRQFLRWWQLEPATAKVLRRRELATTVWSGLMLSLKGAAVKRYIEEQTT